MEQSQRDEALAGNAQDPQQTGRPQRVRHPPSRLTYDEPGVQTTVQVNSTTSHHPNVSPQFGWFPWQPPLFQQPSQGSVPPGLYPWLQPQQLPSQRFIIPPQMMMIQPFQMMMMQSPQGMAQGAHVC